MDLRAAEGRREDLSDANERVGTGDGGEREGPGGGSGERSGGSADRASGEEMERWKRKGRVGVGGVLERVRRFGACRK